MTVPFVTVEGPIGVGKTSLSNAMAQSLEYHLLREIVDENPFLDKFYEDIAEWSFQTEMFFLCNRYKQLSDITKVLTNELPVVADYHIFKNLIFAKRTLEPVEYKKYEAIYSILTAEMPTPNIIVYLNASVDTLMQRIALRGREFEKRITRDYMEQLAKDYDEFILQFEQAHPEIFVIRVNGDAVDFVNNSRDRQEVLNTIQMVINEKIYLK